MKYNNHPYRFKNSKSSSVNASAQSSELSFLPGKTIIITDENILRIYGNDFPNVPVISIGLGEKHKTMETLDADL